MKQIKHVPRMYVCMYVCMYSQQGMDQPRYTCQSYSWSAEQGKLFLPYPRSRVIIWSRETGSAVPSRASLVIFILRLNLVMVMVLTRGLLFFLLLSAAASNHLYRQTPPGQSRVYRVMKLRTDGVHCREYAGTKLVVLKVTGAVNASNYSGNPMVQLMCTSLFPHPPLVQ